MAEKLRKTGIDVIGDVHWGTHFCQFYQTRKDLTDILVPYFKAGLENNEFCMWVVSQPMTEQDAKGALREAIPEIDYYLDKGQIEILFYDDWYVKDCGFDSQRVLHGWIDKLNSALAGGYDGLRLTGNTFWLEDKDWKDFVAYEKEVESVIHTYRMIALCTYSLDKCRAAEVIDVVNNHEFALIKRAGNWERIENSKHKTAVDTLQQNEEQQRKINYLLSAILNTTHVLIACLDAECNFIMVNKMYADADGKEPDFFIGKNHFALYPDAENEVIFRKVVASGEPYYARAKPFEYVENPQQGVSYWDWSLVPIKDEAGTVKMVVLSLQDITIRIKAQMAVHESELRYRSLFNGMTEGFALNEIICDEKGKPVDYRFLEVNPAFERFTGLKREDVLNKTMYEILPSNDPYWVDIFGKVALTGEPVHFENYSSALEKHYEVFAYCPAPNSFATVFMDITDRRKAEEELLRYREHLEELVKERTIELEERNKKLGEEISERIKAEKEKKKMEAQLIQSQKMEALGRFAGGIAHDLNNVLSPIIINTETLLEDAKPDTNHHEILKQTLTAAHRQRDLVKKILSFSRRSKEDFFPIRISPLLEETIGFLRSSLPSTIEILSHIDVSSDMIVGDPIQIQQIIMNLCKNAADALESQRGFIELKLRSTYLEPVHTLQEITAGNYLELTVRDTGSGMPQEVMDQIFDPFFTTKAKGKGSGMGLSIVHGILKNHKGTISVESEPGKGSVFTIYLPLYSGSSQTVASYSNEDHPGSEISGDKKKRILVIDDEEIILSSLHRVLGRSGYHVETVEDGQKALKVFGEAPDKFDLIITDQTMPGMTGTEISRKISVIRSDIPVILCTGLSDIIDEQNAKSIGIREILLKPTGIRELKSAVHRAFERENI